MYSRPYVFDTYAFSKFASQIKLICGGGQLLVTGSHDQGPRVPGVRIPCLRGASPKAQGPSSRVPESQVSESQVPGRRVSGFRVRGLRVPDPGSQVLILDFLIE